MQQVVGPTGPCWNLAPQPLLTGMFQPPTSTFTRSYGEQTIRFPYTIGELFGDSKAVGKRYAAAMLACKNKAECAISFASTTVFEKTVRAVIDELRLHSID